MGVALQFVRHASLKTDMRFGICLAQMRQLKPADMPGKPLAFIGNPRRDKLSRE